MWDTTFIVYSAGTSTCPNDDDVTPRAPPRASTARVAPGRIAKLDQLFALLPRVRVRVAGALQISMIQ